MHRPGEDASKKVWEHLRYDELLCEGLYLPRASLQRLGEEAYKKWRVTQPICKEQNKSPKTNSKGTQVLDFKRLKKNPKTQLLP
jgi:hypothetical protein